MYLVGLDGFETPAEELKAVSLLVHLHPLAVILDLGVHPIGTLFHCHGNRTTGFSLMKMICACICIHYVIIICTSHDLT